MNIETEKLESFFDNIFHNIKNSRESFHAPITLKEVGTITSIATGIAKVSGLPNVGFEEI